MSTLNDIASYVAVDILNRNDLLPYAVGVAKRVYNMVCGKVPFDALRVTSDELSLTEGTAVYSLSSLTPKLAGIISIRLSISSTNTRRLWRKDTRLYDALGSQRPGIPSSYARFGGNIEINPVPNSSTYTYRIRYWSYPTIASDVAETELVIPEEWDELLEWETLYRIYNGHLKRPDLAMQLVMPSPMPRQATPTKVYMYEPGIIPRLWNEMLQTINSRENVDEDFGVQPIIRPYTHA